MVSLTRAGSKLILRTSPAPGHYLCIKWDFASLPLRAAALRVYKTQLTQRGAGGSATSCTHNTNSQGQGWCIQRLVVETVDVERGSAHAVGGDNVLRVIPPQRARRTFTDRRGAHSCLNGVLSQWFVFHFG